MSDPEDNSLNALAMKLPLFWVDNPRMWFQTAEAQFRIKKITCSSTKFDHVLARIPSELTLSLTTVVSRATATPPSADPYTELKDRLLEATLPGPYKMLDTLLDHPTLGDRTPSKMMDQMLNLLPPGCKPDILFNALFLRRLPANLRQVLATQKHETQHDLAKAADHLHDSGAPPAAGLSLVSSGASACALPADSSGRGRSPPRSSNSRSATPGRSCFYHARWAEKANKCEPPCNWSGNGAGGGRNNRRRN